MSEQPYFDAIGEHFLTSIYQSVKGKIRMAVLMRDLAPYLHAGMHILDIGGGAGQMAFLAAQKGCRVTVIDCANHLLEVGRTQAKNLGLEEQVSFIESDVFAYDFKQAQFDGVFCHAVLEWLPKTDPLFALIDARVKDNGLISLMFYNYLALNFIHHVFGNFAYIARGFKSAHRAKLTPDYARCPDEIAQAMDVLNWQRIARSGVRCFFDYMKEKDRNLHSDEEIIAQELSLSLQQEYINVARYVHELRRK